MTQIKLPERLHLARLPTPVERLPRLSRELGVKLLVKRDDLTGASLSGNKIRKLEFSLAEARRQEASCVLTTGGVQSNHCRATAIAARKLGLAPYLLLRTPDGRAPSESDGNLLLDRLVGARIRYVTPEEYATREILLARWADELREAGERPFQIPEGASDALGALGYLQMVQELLAQHQAGEIPGGKLPQFIVVPCGSGGTAAGLAAGLALSELDMEVIAYAVCDDAVYFRQKIDGLLRDVAAGYTPALDPVAARYSVEDGFKGIGYAQSTPEELTLLREVARTEGLLLDPVYTGKAFGGLVQELRAGGRYPPGATILFVHTGGLYGLFPKRGEIPGLTDEG
jgi:D-cysteine desulfhydrase